MSKTEQKACLSTLSFPQSQPLPRHPSPGPQPIPRPNMRRVKSAPATVPTSDGPPSKNPDYILTFCFVLVYLELGWLILLLLRSYSRY